MKLRTMILTSALAGLALTTAPDSATADPKHCPPGLDMQNRCGKNFRDFDRSREFDRRSDHRTDAYEQGYRDGRRDARLEIGDRLTRDSFRVLDRDLYYDRYGQHLDDRYYYAEADGRRLLIEAATGAIIDMLSR